MRRDLLVLDQMITACDRSTQICTRNSLLELERNEEPREALLWNVTVLGEAASQVSSELRETHPSIPWRNPVSLRNRIVHGYWTIDLQVIHNTALNELPGLRAQLAELLQQLEAE